MSTHWLVLISVILVIPLAFKLAMTFVGFKYYFHKAIWYSPIFGEMLRMSQMAFYFQYLSLMYESGVVMSTALTGVKNAVSNTFFRSRLESVESTLRAGYSLAESFAEPGLFEPLALRMVAVGEQTGGLDTQLQRLSDNYFHELQAKIEVMSKIIEPLIMAIVGLFFAFFAIALLGPLYDLIAGVG